MGFTTLSERSIVARVSQPTQPNVEEKTMAARIQITETPVTLTLKNRQGAGTAYQLQDELPGYVFEVIHIKGGRRAKLCGTCSGTGYRPEYGNVFNGVCFHCNGSGVHKIYDDTKAAEKAARAWLGRQRSEHKKQEAIMAAAAEARAKMDAEFNAWIADKGDVVAYIEANAESSRSRFLPELDAQLKYRNTLTDNQVAAVRRMMAEQETQRWYGEPGDKVTFTGIVERTFSGHNDYGTYYMVTVRGTGEFTGVLFHTTGTSKVHIELQDCEGDTVTIAATVKKHDTYDNTKQTVVLRPKLISQEPTLDPETEAALEAGEPKWAGELHVIGYNTDTWKVFPVNGTRDAYDMLCELSANEKVSYAYLSFYGAEWNAMHFNPKNLSRYGSSDGKLVSLIDKSNIHYAVTDFKPKTCLRHLTLAQEHLLVEWRKAFGQLQLHVQERGEGTHHACQVSGVQRWGCPEWREMNKPVAELEDRMREAGMAAPYAVLEAPTR
jgi:hypothetical protein